MGKVIDLSEGLSPNAQGSSYKGSFTNWTALNTALPTSSTGDTAVVENAEGTAWLPWTLGGTYYPQGTYYWDGAIWSSNVEDIAEALSLIAPIVTIAKNINYTAIVNDYVLMTTGAADKTVTLPLTPTKDNKVVVMKYDAGTGLCIVNGNGKNILGETSVSIMRIGTSLPFRYDGTQWIIE